MTSSTCPQRPTSPVAPYLYLCLPASLLTCLSPLYLPVLPLSHWVLSYLSSSLPYLSFASLPPFFPTCLSPFLLTCLVLYLPCFYLFLLSSYLCLYIFLAFLFTFSPVCPPSLPTCLFLLSSSFHSLLLIFFFGFAFLPLLFSTFLPFPLMSTFLFLSFSSSVSLSYRTRFPIFVFFSLYLSIFSTCSSSSYFGVSSC